MKFNASLMLANYFTRNIRCLNLLICVMLDLSLDILESMNFKMIYKQFFEVWMWSLMKLSTYQGQGRCLSWLGHSQDWHSMGKNFGLIGKVKNVQDNILDPFWKIGYHIWKFSGYISDIYLDFVDSTYS